MFELRRHWGAGRVAVLAALLVIGLIPLHGCSKEEVPPPPPAPSDAGDAPAAPDAATPAEKTSAAAVKEAIPGSGQPPTVEVLKLMPEQTGIAIAAPSARGLFDKGVALAKRILPPEADLDAMLKQKAHKMAEEAGTKAADSPLDVFASVGFDPDAPLGFFFDAAAATEFITTAPPTLEESRAMGRTEPPYVIVASYTDKALFEKALLEGTKAAKEGETPPAETIDVDGIEIKAIPSEELAYFFTDRFAVVSSSADLARGVASRVKNPATVRYGTAECPAGAPDEVVMLAHMDKLIPMMSAFWAFTSTKSQAPPAAGGFALWSSSLAQAAEAYAGDDPLVATLEWTPEKLDLLTRLDLKTHPGVTEYAGDPAPLRHPALLPVNTTGMFSLHLSPVAKQRIAEAWANTLPKEANADSAARQASSLLTFISSIIGDEMTIAITGIRNDMPQVALLIGLANAEETQNLLQMVGLNMNVRETYKDIAIGMPDLPLPIPLFVAFVDKSLVLALHPGDIKAIIDRSKKGEGSPFLEMLDPPLDPAVPRHSMFIARNALLTDVFMPMFNAPGLPPGMVPAPSVDFMGLFDEIRYTQDVVDNWQRGRTTIFLKQ